MFLYAGKARQSKKAGASSQVEQALNVVLSTGRIVIQLPEVGFSCLLCKVEANKGLP